MSARKSYEKKMQNQFAELKAEVERLGQKADQAETNLELEYFTLVDELQLKLQSVEQKLELLRQANDDRWEHFKADLEHSWESLRELIKAVTSP